MIQREQKCYHTNIVIVQLSMYSHFPVPGKIQTQAYCDKVQFDSAVVFLQGIIRSDGDVSFLRLFRRYLFRLAMANRQRSILVSHRLMSRRYKHMARDLTHRS